MGFTFSRADGSQRSVSGYIHEAPAASCKTFNPATSRVQQLPPAVDLRPHMTNIEDQGPVGSCVANAVAGAYEYLVKRHKGIDTYDVSRLFIYYNARTMDGSENPEDEGCCISKAIESLKEYGACSETTWPYDPEQKNDEPSDESYEEASQFLVEDMMVVPTDLNAWKKCIAEGLPIIFGSLLFGSFDKHKKKGVVPLPTPAESGRDSHGAHAMLAVGYSDTDKVFIVRNSWGTDWGDKGYCYIPYDYLMNPKLNLSDSWIIRQLDNFELNEEDWGDEESILPEVDSELAEMDEDTYQQMLDAMGDHPLEYRIALVLLHAAAADKVVSDEELSELSTYLEDLLKRLGVDMSAKKILRNARRDLKNKELFDESIELMGEYLSKGLLARFINDAARIAGVDDLSEAEEGFIADLVEAWQVEEGEDEDEDDEDEDEDEDDEDEDDEDEDDEDEDDEDEDE